MALRLSPEDRAYLSERLRFCRTELADLAEYSTLSWPAYQADRKSRRNIERIIENVCNAVIDLSKSLLAAADSPPPATYREALFSLPLTGLVDETEAEGLAVLAPLRNSLSHQYLDYKWSAIRKFMETDSAFVNILLDRVEELLVRHSGKE